MLALLSAMVLTTSTCGPLDLPTVLSLVASRSDEVAIKNAEVLGAAADVSLARALGIVPLATATLLTGPAPGAHGNVLFSQNSNREPFRDLGPFGRVDINVVQPIWTWGQLGAARAGAEAGLSARSLLVTDEVRKVQQRVVQLYWGVVLARRFLAIAADVASALDQAQDHIEKALKEGKGEVSQEDRFRVQVFRGDLLARRADAEKGLKLARIALAGTLGLEEGALELKEDVLPSDFAPSRLTEGEVADAAEKRRPDLMALDAALRAREADVRANEAARLPTVFVAGVLSYSYAPNRTIQTNPWVSDYFNQLSAGVALGLKENLSFPLLEAQLSKARAELAALRRQRQGLLRLVRVEAESGLAELNGAEQRFSAAQGAVKAGKGWFRSNTLSFGLGVTDARSLLESYAGYVQTQVNEAQSRFDLLVARARLDVLMGNLLATGGSECALP